MTAKQMRGGPSGEAGDVAGQCSVVPLGECKLFSVVGAPGSIAWLDLSRGIALWLPNEEQVGGWPRSGVTEASYDGSSLIVFVRNDDTHAAFNPKESS